MEPESEPQIPELKQVGPLRFCAAVSAVLLGLFLFLVGGVQLGYGLYRLKYPNAWIPSRDPADGKYGYVALHGLWMHPVVRPEKNLTTVGLATISGLFWILSAAMWRLAAARQACITTLLAAGLGGVFLMRVLSI